LAPIAGRQVTVKRVGGTFERISAFDNLVEAARKAQRGKRFRRDVSEFNLNLERELVGLQHELAGGTYRPGPYKTFAIRDPKPRIISAAPYRDRVVHHAICAVIEPIFERSFIHDSYACRRGKGAHAAVDRLTRLMGRADYAMKLDMRRFFPSVDHAVLRAIVRRKLKCARTLELLDLVIANGDGAPTETDYLPGDDLFTPLERAKGLPIGNQTSQFLANVYLDPLDHFAKETLGCSRYIRYADDIVIVEDDRATLADIRRALSDFALRRLRLRFHVSRADAVPVHCGMTYLGYRVYPTHRLLVRANGVRFARTMRRMQRLFAVGQMTGTEIGKRIVGWIGHAAHADTHGLRTALIEGVVFRRE